SLEDYEKAITLGSTEAHDYANCGRVRSHLKDFAGALDDYTRALERSAGDPTIYSERGRAYLALRKFGQALEDFKSAVKLDAFLKNPLGPLIAECEAAGPPK
ncbi:MAG TPA: hypothetical protein VG457_12630, partial [Planctomycetota bacterium]|nr:hypothetical protein [Planctomycetota bacterium]